MHRSLGLVLLVGWGCSRDRPHDPAGDAGASLVESVQAAVVDDELAKIHDKVAADSIAQYEIAKREGDKMQICASAGMVSASYLQAKNEPKYREWKAVEKADCAAARMPDPSSLAQDPSEP